MELKRKRRQFGEDHPKDAKNALKKLVNSTFHQWEKLKSHYRADTQNPNCSDDLRDEGFMCFFLSCILAEVRDLEVIKIAGPAHWEQVFSRLVSADEGVTLIEDIEEAIAHIRSAGVLEFRPGDDIDEIDVEECLPPDHSGYKEMERKRTLSAISQLMDRYHNRHGEEIDLDGPIGWEITNNMNLASLIDHWDEHCISEDTARHAVTTLLKKYPDLGEEFHEQLPKAQQILIEDMLYAAAEGDMDRFWLYTHHLEQERSRMGGSLSKKRQIKREHPYAENHVKQNKLFHDLSSIRQVGRKLGNERG